MDRGDERTYAIVGAAMEVHRELGNGFLEAIYQQALAIEFETRRIPFRREVEILVSYKGRQLDSTYRADFICFDEVVVELKALARFGGTEQSQVINYMKATGFKVALLLNFGTPSLEYRRFVF
ncbi:MAG: GxxExxY protein [Candidatus Binataceae bacterium]